MERLLHPPPERVGEAGVSVGVLLCWAYPPLSDQAETEASDLINRSLPPDTHGLGLYLVPKGHVWRKRSLVNQSI
jgi:hypothetical protein